MSHLDLATWLTSNYLVMKKIQAYKHVSHKTDSNKPYFILQFLLKLAYFANFAQFFAIVHVIFRIFCNF